MLTAYPFHKFILHLFQYFSRHFGEDEVFVVFPTSVIQVPSSEIQDKILFMINNISLSNMDMKAKEFSEVLKEQYYPWFAQYMVMRR